MDGRIREELIKKGVDYRGALHRFLDMEDMYVKFLRDYLNDQNIQIVSTSIANKDIESAFRASHTIKGLAANLGLDCIVGPASQLTDLLRNKSYEEIEINQINEAYDRLKLINDEILNILAQI